MGGKRVRLTKVGRILSALGAGGVLAGVVTLSLPPATMGLVALVYVAFGRVAAAADFKASHLRATRQLSHEGRVGEPVEVTLDATATRVPEGIRVRLTDQPPSRARVEGPTLMDAPAVISYAVTPTRRGKHVFPFVLAQLTDRRGLWEMRRPLPVRTETMVLPSLEPLARGRSLANRPPALEIKHTSAAGAFMVDLDFESIREFRSGDRMKDIDWKRVSAFEELMTKTRERETLDPIIFVIDASRTMRAAQEHGPTKLDQASAIAVQLTTIATRSGHAVGHVAYDEGRIVASAVPRLHGNVPMTLLSQLGKLPEPIAIASRLDVADGASPRAAGEVPFLSKVTSQQPGPGRDLPADDLARRIVARFAAARARELLVIVLTDLESDPDVPLRVVSRSLADRHRVAVGLLPGSRYLAPPESPTLRDLEEAYRERTGRAAAQKRLRSRGVRVIEIGPADDAQELRQAARGGGQGGRAV